MSKRKLLVIDTSVLLYDKASVHSFPGNDVVLPLIVLDELDRFKERLDQGVLIDENTDQTIKVTASTPKLDPKDHLDPTRGDNMIIAAALDLKKSFPKKEVKVITKDINLRVKCDALGILAEDYYKDYIDDVDDNFDGVDELYLSDEKINLLYENGSCDIEESDYELHPNTYVVCKGSSMGKSALAVYTGKDLCTLNSFGQSETGVTPRNKEQKFAWHALNSADIPLVTLTGLAGSGKTFLALMSGIDALYDKTYERIVVTRSIEPVGRDIGYLPGDVNEKMAPWMSPLLDNFKHHFKDRTYFELMLEKGQIEIAPLSFIRGRTFNNSFLIVDEAQNATIHELKTIITRIGENSKVVLMGDTDQIDTPYIDKRSNGLAIVIEKFKTSDLSAHVHLCRGERSSIATYASKVL